MSDGLAPPPLDASFYDLTQTLWGAFATAMGAARAREPEPPTPISPLLQLRAGLAESPGWFLIQAAEFDPEPLSVERLRVRDVYACEGIVAALLELMAGEKWFDRDGDDPRSAEYALRFEGRAVLDRLHANRRRWLGALTLPPAAEQLEAAFAALIERSQGAPDPPGTWCLAHSRNRASLAEDSPAARLFQYVADFNAFRDDCHMAAWRPLGVAGNVWEAFGLVANGTGPTADALFDALAYRGYSAADYAAALEKLASRGWVAAGAEGYTVTDAGRAVRDEVEERTNSAFYAPWDALSVSETVALRDNIHTLNEALERVAAT